MYKMTDALAYELNQPNFKKTSPIEPQLFFNRSKVASEIDLGSKKSSKKNCLPLCSIVACIATSNEPRCLD